MHVLITMLRHLDGKSLDITGPQGKAVRPGEVWMLKGYGMPKRGNPRAHGDLLIRFEVDFPEALPADASRELLRPLLDPKVSQDVQEALGFLQAPFDEGPGKPSTRSSELQKAIQRQCDNGNGQKTTSCGANCEELRLALAAAQKALKGSGTAKWQELMDAMEALKVLMLLLEEPSAGMEHEERRTLVSMVLGRNVPDSYFLADEREVRAEDRHAEAIVFNCKKHKALQSAMEEIVEKSCVTFQEAPCKDLQPQRYVFTPCHCGSSLAEGKLREDISKDSDWRTFHALSLAVFVGCRSSLGSAFQNVLCPPAFLTPLVHSTVSTTNEQKLARDNEENTSITRTPPNPADHQVPFDYTGGPYVQMIDSEVGSGRNIRLNMGTGQKHEQSRPDRDHFLDIRWNNAFGPQMGPEGMNQGEDYMSIMHYSRFAFSKNSIAADMLASWLVSWTLNQLGKIGIDTQETLPASFKFNSSCIDIYERELDTFSPEAIITEDWFKVGTGYLLYVLSQGEGGEMLSPYISPVGHFTALDQLQGAKPALYLKRIVQVQAHCIRSLAIRQAQGMLWYQESIARITSWPQRMVKVGRWYTIAMISLPLPWAQLRWRQSHGSCEEQLPTACSKAVATNSNDQVAVAICADLAAFGDSVLPTAELRVQGYFYPCGSPCVLDADGAGIQPIQSFSESVLVSERWDSRPENASPRY
ncbi:DnaJ-like subfamily A member 2 [Symbiodinium microadriaticum]|uniref:DnaJ-like subfamily A member 2 n=1 Tax=Symbiodinium microadriaticum TaxID=2951 RepID=A0A1Q9ERR5_SYMMI|nr:DnaJ-like subfamily A member 2 [Symbiodinium microadriaticum]